MNPIVTKLIEWAIPFCAGFVLAFTVQALRLQHSEQEFTQYKQDQTATVQRAKDEANRIRQANEAIAQAATEQLNADIDAGEVYRRCLAAGKCRRVPVGAGNCPAATVPAVAGSDADRGGAIPVAGGAATSPGEAGGVCEGLAADAAKVQLRLNLLQGEIEAQPGYSVAND